MVVHLYTRARSFGALPLFKGFVRPPVAVQNDYRKAGIKVGFSAGRLLADYPSVKYDALLDRLIAFKEIKPFAEVFVDPAGRIKDIDFRELSPKFLVEQIRGKALDLTKLTVKHSNFLRREDLSVGQPGWPGSLSLRPLLSLFLPVTNVPTPAPTSSTNERREEPYSPTQYSETSAIFYSRQFSTEYNGNPARNLARLWWKIYPEASNVVAAEYGTTIPEDEMKDHVLYVSHVLFDRVGEMLTGFASIDEYSDYRNPKGEKDKLIYYSGIQIRPEYRGGRTAYLTFLAMKKIFASFGLFKLLFGRTPLVMRLQSQSIFELTRPYIKTKQEAAEFTDEDWAAINFVARKKGWTFEAGTNITRGVYSKLMAKNQADRLPDLDDLDGKVCIGYASVWTLLRLYYAYKVRGKTGYNGP